MYEEDVVLRLINKYEMLEALGVDPETIAFALAEADAGNKYPAEELLSRTKVYDVEVQEPVADFQAEMAIAECRQEGGRKLRLDLTGEVPVSIGLLSSLESLTMRGAYLRRFR